jgi:hypothetical protein
MHGLACSRRARTHGANSVSAALGEGEWAIGNGNTEYNPTPRLVLYFDEG